MPVDDAILLSLGVPTPPQYIKKRQGPGGRMLDYVDARYVMQFLDDTVGPANWQDEYAMGEGGKVSCRIGIRVGTEWVWKGDGAGETDIEGEKGSFSDAFKRAAVKWGIARDLYGASTSGTGRAAPSSPTRPAAASSTPEEPDWLIAGEPRFDGQTPMHNDAVCPDHDLAWILRPGGVSKTTGKPYDAFWACPSSDRPFCKNKPSQTWQERHAA